MTRWLSLIILLCMLSIAGFGLFRFTQFSQIETRANLLITDVTTSALGSWTTNPIFDLAHPDLHLNNSEPQLSQAINSLRPIGSLTTLQDITFSRDETAWWQSPEGMTRHYDMVAYFELATARIEISLIYTDGRWLISDYQIYPPILPA